MVHLVGLAGSPGARPMDEVLSRARRDAETLAGLGYDAVLIENYGDLPFLPGRVEEHTVVAMTLAAREIAGRLTIPLGINVLRNDPVSALAIASLVGGRFIRVNVHAGVRATDQGIIEGRAHETLRYRDRMGSDVMVFADISVKHSKSIDGGSLEEEARETAYRGLADALIVTGSATGAETAVADVEAVRKAVPDKPILVGSGVTSENVRSILGVADGIIVGSDLKKDGRAENAVDPARAQRLLHYAGR
ncbi:MAG: BtpA/SgcQ family protein [Candidatus Eisenbacteria sp.]|nr:BtpA/SgcQ family protein [Candidatus Eisenbacteria bacterium]